MNTIADEISGTLFDYFCTLYPNTSFNLSQFAVVRSSGKYVYNGLKGIAIKTKYEGKLDDYIPGIQNRFKGDQERLMQGNMPSYLIGMCVELKKNSVVFTLGTDALCQMVDKINTDGIQSRLKLCKKQRLKILVDFSSPNIAKDMHVGHLRSTIIGDSICRTFKSYGHKVQRINHIGDFGLPFGMVIQHILDNEIDFTNFSIGDLQKIYADSKAVYDLNKPFNRRAHARVCDLQSGDPLATAMWKIIRDVSIGACRNIYEKLDIKLKEVGESFYRKQIPEMIAEMVKAGMVEVAENGAQIVKVDGYKFPLILIKSDGAYTYATTDLAAIRYRFQTLKMDRVYYVVDSGQKKHFELVFEVAKKMKWVVPPQSAVHVEFGLVLGENGSRIKSRDGGTVKLESLLNEACTATEVSFEKRYKDPEMPPAESLVNIAYGAVKYADLATNRKTNYKFSFRRMLSFDGNTAVYLLYAYTRIRSIMRKCQPYVNPNEMEKPIELDGDVQNGICQLLVQINDVMKKTSDTLMFHTMCDYLYQIARSFHSLYKSCRVLQYDTDEITVLSMNHNVFKLFCAIEKVMKFGFDILGIKTVEKM